jgi:hypothetical protein
MLIVKILKRRDAASILVAIILAMIISGPLMSTTGRLAGVISGVNNPIGAYPGGPWKEVYLSPVVWAIVQIIALEVLCWVYVIVRKVFVRK